jgi:hypothetical protein
MRLTTVPFGKPSEVHSLSDVASLNFSAKGLVVRVVRALNAMGRADALDVTFRDASAVRYLDEVDLARYWTSEGFIRQFHVLEVTGGGWSEEENELQGYTQLRREWLVVTGNGCVSVFATDEPQIDSVDWLSDP